MSNNDKTRKKLVDSMRKTKESTHKKTVQSSANSGRTNDNKIMKKKMTRNRTFSSSNKQKIDLYQASPRIWPD